MQIILTHEQADLDALGALLGAHLMNEGAVPVLPRKMNRNCRAFLALYGAELPFIEAVDLPNEPVDSVTLVDTQSLVTIKGVSTRTRVQVVDHHSRRADLPAGWELTTEPTGSCTTLFVEGLREKDHNLVPLHATLLLLGIYEDTGSLTFASTTARDARAVGYLLEQGASLQVANRHLNPPLSAEQRAVCDRLLAAAETFQIYGQPVVVASADALEMSDEISSVAHKMRDLLDPSALFLLVRTPEGIRLVARSTTDRIDVSAVAGHFGGGGHNRAAAALLHLPLPQTGPLSFPSPEDRPPLEKIRAELIRVLPSYVRPPVIVQQIMSRHPRLLAPETSLDEAARLMQRYGYEGFPVVRDGKVLGLLTRRAVDRAISHRLNLPASSLMEAGEITVRSDDPVEALREKMIQTGWGQIPVIDPATDKIVGIVTRTDLLKQLGGRPGQPGRDNLARKLEAALPAPRLAFLKAIAGEAREGHLALYIVGGFVRDLILDRPGLDFDIVVEGDAITLGRRLEKRYGGRILPHGRFGTAKWTIADIRAGLARQLADEFSSQAYDPAALPETLDLISARTEFYDYPTALPTVERSSIKLDLHRRDFTINTLALRLDGHHYGDLYDYWGGLRDLRTGQVRVLHSLSFVDDPTRQIRAVRFEQRFGFKIEERTLELMGESSALIRHLSGDRVRHELNLVLQEERALPMLKRLGELGLLEAIHPDLPELDADLEHVFECALFQPIPAGWELGDKAASLPLRAALAYLAWLVRLPLPGGAAVAERIRLPGQLREMLAAAHALAAELPALKAQPPSQQVLRLDSVPRPTLYALYLLNQPGPAADMLQRYATQLSKIWPYTNGEDLVKRGLQPGPGFKDILFALRAAWLDGEISSKDQELELLAMRIVQNG